MPFNLNAANADKKIPPNGTVDELIKRFDQAAPQEKDDFFDQIDPGKKQQLFDQIDPGKKQQLFDHLDFEDKRKLYNRLSTDEKQQLFEQLGFKEQQNISEGVRSPTQRASDRLWLIITLSFAIVLLGAFLSIAFGIFLRTEPAGLQILLTMFTSAVGFLAGLLVPPPTRGNQSQGSK